MSETSAAAPAPTVTQEEMNEWYNSVQELQVLKDKEMLLRKKIFAAYFVEPVEGTNTAKLPDGWALKGQYKIDRKVDEAALTTLADVFKAHKIPVKELIKYKPELSITAYRALDEEERKLFDQVLVIKPGSPALEITKPKRAL